MKTEPITRAQTNEILALLWALLTLADVPALVFIIAIVMATIRAFKAVLAGGWFD